MRKLDKLAVLLLCFLVLCPLISLSAAAESYIVKLKNESIPAELAELLTEVSSEHALYTADNVSILDEFSEYIEYAEINDEIILFESTAQVKLSSLPHDEYYSEQWQTKMVNAEFAWNLEAYGNEVNVAVIDTGCNAHEDINLAGGYNFVLDNNDYTDNYGHGTHVAGIISAQHNNIGIAGIAPKVNIYALKCAEPNHYADTDKLVKAVYAAVDTYNCKVINMSLGVLENKRSLHDAVKYATDKGAIVISAAGNDGNASAYKSRAYYPASYDEVIGVGSVGSAKKRSDFSQQNKSVFVVAPGEEYRSTVGTKEYDFKYGTSQATSIVSAAAAILFSVDKDMTADEFKNYIITCSEPLEDAYCGYGLLNIEAMLRACIKNTACYISPINSGSVLIFNNSESVLNAIGIFAEYKNKVYVSSNVNKITLSPGEKAKINYSNSKGNELKFFLLNLPK